VQVPIGVSGQRYLRAVLFSIPYFLPINTDEDSVELWENQVFLFFNSQRLFFLGSPPA
jgi:hypothetical protein